MIQKLNNTITGLGEEHTSLPTKIAELRQELDAATELKEQNETKFNELLEAIKKLEKSLKTAEEIISAGEQAISELQAECEAMVNTISKMSDTIDDKNGEVRIRDEKLSTLESS